MNRHAGRKITGSLLGLVALIALGGCAEGGKFAGNTPAALVTTMQGRVHGGQQPVSGATIQLYKANLTGATIAATPLITSTVTTDGAGGFTISGTYTCQASDLLYITATGGNPGVSGALNNSALAMMAGLGPCSTVLGTNRFISINELTTVATAWALSPFMTRPTQLSVAADNVMGLTQAFATVNKLVDTNTGMVGGPALVAGATLPVSEINTLADILAACVNTVDSGTAQSSQCSNIFTTISPGNSPTDIISAAIYLARQPKTAVSLYSMATPSSPFQPTLTAAPTSWTIAINYTGGGLSTPKGLAVDFSGNVWIANSGNNSVTELSNTGAALSGPTGFTAGAMNAPVAVAIDLSNNVWVANSGNSTVTELNNAGTTGHVFTGGGLSVPRSIAIDTFNNVWIANYGNSSVTQLSNSGAAVSGPLGYTGGGIAQPTAIAISPY